MGKETFRQCNIDGVDRRARRQADKRTDTIFLVAKWAANERMPRLDCLALKIRSLNN